MATVRMAVSRSATALLCVMALVLAGCGSSDSTTPTPTATGSVSPTAATSPSAVSPSQTPKSSAHPSASPSGTPVVPTATPGGSPSASPTPVPTLDSSHWKTNAASKPCNLLTLKQLGKVTGSKSVSIDTSSTTPTVCVWDVASTNGTSATVTLTIYPPANVSALQALIDPNDPASVITGSYPTGSAASAQDRVIRDGGGFELDGTGTVKGGSWTLLVASLAGDVIAQL